MIEIGVVRHHNGAVTAARFNAFTYNFKNFVQRLVFADRAAIGIVRVNTVEGEGLWLQICADKWFDVEM